MNGSVLLAGVLLAALASPSSAAFIVPDTASYGWDRGLTPLSTYAEWNVFSSPLGPNAPDVGSFVGGVLPDGAPAFNAFDSNEGSGSFITGGGNIYSFAGVVSPRIEFGGFGLGDGSLTTVLLQVRTLGTEIDQTTVRLNGVIAPVGITELARVSLGGFGGSQVDTLIRFDLTGNLSAYTIDFDALGSSLSLDRVAIDTFTVVPAPGALALVGAASLLVRRRRRD